MGRGAHGQVPVDEGEELALEQIEFLDARAANLCVVAVRAEDVAEGLRGDCDGRDDEAMDGERRNHEARVTRADLVNVMQRDEETRFLRAQRSVIIVLKWRRRKVNLDLGVLDDPTEIFENRDSRRRA